MNIDSVLSQSPYHSAFDDTKNYVQVLFKPDTAVQSRELNDVASIARDQMKKFASHVFENGSRVSGGNAVAATVPYLKIKTTSGGVPVVREEWLGKKIVEKVDGTATGVTAQVVMTAKYPTDDFIILYVVRPEDAGDFHAGSVLNIDGTFTTASLVDGPEFSGKSIHVHVEEGVYTFDGVFIRVPKQTVVADPYVDDTSGVFGVTYKVEPVTVDEDPNLADPAKGSSNYNAIGADRLSINCEFKFFKLPSQEALIPSEFVSIIEFRNGGVVKDTKVPVYSEIANELARRTYEESGNYTVYPYTIAVDTDKGLNVTQILRTAGSDIVTVSTTFKHGYKVGDNIDITGALGTDAPVYNGRFSVLAVIDDVTFTYKVANVPLASATGTALRVSLTDYMSVTVGPGKSYVYGFENETVADTEIRVPRARSTQVSENYSVSSFYGNYLTVRNIIGPFDTTSNAVINLRDAGGVTIGTARLRNLSHVSGTGAAAVYRAYVYDMTMSTAKLSLVKSISSGSSAADIVDVAALSDAGNDSMLFRVPNAPIKTLYPNGLSDVSYVTQRRFTQASSGGTNSVSITVTGNDTFVGPINQNFAGTALQRRSYLFWNQANGSHVSPSSAIISANGKTITFLLPASATYEILGHVQSSQAVAKTKTVVVETYTVTYDQAFGFASLGVADVFQLDQVIRNNNGTNITNRFALDTGQTTSLYDHAKVRINGPRSDIAHGETLNVTVRRFAHSGSGQYFSADSYASVPDNNVPSLNGVSLRDMIDFRPVRQPGTLAVVVPATPVADSLINSDYEFYLPRKDLVVIDKTGKIRVITGEPDLNPAFPILPGDSMILYRLTTPAYTSDPSSAVTAQFVENKRYTMRDIGRIEKRVDRLEYLTALSLLEMKTSTTPVVDANGNERFKNGFLVDDFTGHKIGDVHNPDYKCSIDPISRELRPAFVSNRRRLVYTLAESTAHRVLTDEGTFLTLPYTEVVLSKNLVASKAESVNPYLVYAFKGTLFCDPPSDDWMDTTRRPAVNADLTGDADAWNFLASAVSSSAAAGFGTQWGDWQTTWSGVSISASQAVTNSSNTSRTDRGNGTNIRTTNAATTTTTTSTTTTSNQIRRGTQTSLGFDVSTASLGDSVVDVSISYYMRAININVVGQGFRPNTNLHGFIDTIKVNDRVSRLPAYAPTTEGCVRTDANGTFHAVLSIPGGVFRTGERKITFVDESGGNIESATTYGHFIFASSGLSKTVEEKTVSIRTPTLTTTAVTDNRTVSNTATSVASSTVVTQTNRFISSAPIIRLNEGGEAPSDPFAQTFLVPMAAHPQGVMITGVDLFFRRKPTNTQPVWLEVRPVVNGYPHSSKILPLSVVYVHPDNVKIPTRTDSMDSILAAPTPFNFKAPIYLEPGIDYAFTVLSNNPEYECYISELGANIIGTDVVINAQGTLGSLFKSQNASTWTPYQLEDLMHVIRRASFEVGTEKVCIFRPEAGTRDQTNILMLTANALNFAPATSMAFDYTIRDQASGTMDQFESIVPNVNVDQWTEKSVTNPADFALRVKMSTTREDIAPLYDTDRNSITLVGNLVNNNTTGETGSNGGSALERYVTRPITLQSDFETDFVRVTADFNLASGTGVKVYVKAKASGDPRLFQDCPWVEMVRDSNKSIVTEDYDSFIEDSFIPANGSLAYSYNGVAYDRVQTYAIKIVGTSTNTCRVPRVRDFRAVTAVV